MCLIILLIIFVGFGDTSAQFFNEEQNDDLNVETINCDLSSILYAGIECLNQFYDSKLDADDMVGFSELLCADVKTLTACWYPTKMACTGSLVDVIHNITVVFQLMCALNKVEGSTDQQPMLQWIQASSRVSACYTAAQIQNNIQILSSYSESMAQRVGYEQYYYEYFQCLLSSLSVAASDIVTKVHEDTMYTMVDMYDRLSALFSVYKGDINMGVSLEGNMQYSVMLVSWHNWYSRLIMFYTKMSSTPDSNSDTSNSNVNI